jgi:catechol 2,3-dioxygenase-like lactoylglutathione lyase family enzyme
MATVQVRYIVHDVDAAIVFYTKQLGFSLEMHPAPPFAMLSRGDLRLVLSAPNPMGGGGQSMPDGTKPEPGGWNRFAIEVHDLAATVEGLRRSGATFAMRSSLAWAASRSSSRIHRETRLSYSSR